MRFSARRAENRTPLKEKCRSAEGEKRRLCMSYDCESSLQASAGVKLLSNCYLTCLFALVISGTVCYNRPMPATTPGGETGMLRAAQMLRRPVVVIWFLALVTTAV